MELVIAQSVNNLITLKKIASKSVDILVFNQGVMAILDGEGIKYKTIEDLYTAEQYCQDIVPYKKSVNDLFVKLDGLCNNSVGFPYSYSGNELYSLIWFDSILYLEKLIQAMQGKYKKIYLYATHKPKIKSNSHLDFSQLNSYKVNGTISLPLEGLIERNIQLIYNSIDVHFVKDALSIQKNITIKLRLKHFFNRMHRFIDKRTGIKINNTFDNINLNGKHVYVLQDGYEIRYLKKYLPKFKYLNPVVKIRQDVEEKKPCNMLNIPINVILLDFTKDHFIFLNKHVYFLIRSYHLEVVGRIKIFKEKFEYEIKKDKPILLLLSVGVRDVFDSVCCYVANYYNIPVAIFQHGGHGLFGYSPYQESVEYNSKILKNLVIQSNQEMSVVQNEKTKVVCMGCIQQYEANHKSYLKNPAKGVLLCLGPDVNFKFRQLLNYYSTNKKYQQSIDILSSVESTALSIDIKLHPSGEKDSYDCYKDIIKNNQYKNIKVLYGEFGEIISRDYKLIIIDFLLSSLTKHIFSLKVPVIIYDYDFDNLKISEVSFFDLRNRCYIARDKNELRELLERYKAGNLPSKWSVDFIDKYIYPLDCGNPGENTAKYICNIIK